MKLHLPSGLRSALLACFAVVSGLTTVPMAASVAGVTVVATFICSASPAQAVAVQWDANWNVIGAPAEIAQDNVLTTIPSGFTFLSSVNENYLAAGKTIVLLEGTATGASDVVVIGGAGATSGSSQISTSEGPLTADTWLNVTGGSYQVIAGGSYAQNFNGGPLSSFTGDSHIQLSSGSGTTPTTEYIIGGNYNDAQSAPFTGNSYISVQAGSVTGSIVGGGTSAHSDTAIFNGDSNIWVYTPLSSSASAIVSLPNNLIVGGCAGLANASSKLQQNGDSHVTVDLSSYVTSGTASMEKIIIGDAWLIDGTTSNHTGNTMVSIKGTVSGDAQASFSLPVVGGSYFSANGSATLSGNTELSVNGGLFTGAIVGGSFMSSASATNASSTIGGSSSITLGGLLEMSGSDALVIGGSYVNAASGKVQSGAHSITINGGTYGGNIIGGSWIGVGSGTVEQTAGDIALTVNAGSVSGTIYGASYSARDNAASTSEHGSVSITLAGGSILGNVYAGGGLASGVQSGITSASTQVEISNDVSLGSVTISGGVENANAASAVTGERTLLLSGSTAYTNLDNASFEDFTIVNNASAATISLTTMGSTFEKQGTGALSLNGASSDLSSVAQLAVSAGSLDTGTAGLTQNAQGLSSITVGQGALLTTGALTLANAASLALDVTNATASQALIGVTNALTLLGERTMELSLTGVDALAAGSTAALLSWGSVDAPISLSNVNWVNKGSGTEAYTLSIANNMLLLSHAAELEWDGGDGTWNASSDWDGQGNVSSDAKAVTFNTPAGTDTTVTISGDVAPQSIVVANGADTSYTFEADAAGGAITGSTGLTKNEEGSLVVALANTYTGGTTLNAGTLEAAAEGALGTGAVTLNGGELLASAADAVAANALVLNGGSLSYSADETRTLGTAAITHAAGVVPAVSVANGSTVTWEYADASALQDAIGSGLALSGGGTLKTNATADADVALAGDITLSDAGTTLELGSLGSAQLGTQAAPAAVSLAEGTTLRVERPQGANASSLNVSLSGEGVLEFANTNAAANNSIRLSGNNSGFAGSINLGTEGVTPTADTASVAVLLDYSQGSPVGGADAELNLNGLGFALVQTNGSATTTEAAVAVNSDTTQYSQTAGLQNTFSGDVSGAEEATWTLDSTGVDGGQTNLLTGNLSSFEGTLAATGREGSMARWQLGGDAEQENPVIAANLLAGNEYNEFIINSSSAVTLSGAVSGEANLTQQGAGTLLLTGESDSSGTLTIAEGAAVQLGNADDAAEWGNATGGSTLAGAGTLNLVNGSLVGTLNLAAGASPVVNVNVAAGCSVSLGGNDSSLLSGSFTLGEGATLTDVGSSIMDKELNLTLGLDNVGSGTAGTAMVQFVDASATFAARAVTESLGSTNAAINLDTSATGVVNLLRQHRTEGVESYLTLTNGQLVTAADYSNVSFGENMDILSGLGLRIARVDGGSLVLSGAAQGVYIAGEGEDPTSVTGYQNLGAYQAVAVMPGETLTLNLDGAPDPALDGAGATLNNLLGAENSSLVINNTDNTGEVAVVVLNNTLQNIDPVPEGLPGDPVGANTTFAGSMSQQGGDVELVKTGDGTLSVGGTITTQQLTAQAGTIALNASGSTLGVLAAEGGTIQLNTGTTTATSLEDSDAGGSISIAEGATLANTGTGNLEAAQIAGPGTLLLSGELTLAENAALSGVALEVEGGTLGLNGNNASTVSALNGNGTLNGTGTAETSGLSITGTGGSFSGSLAGTGTLTLAEGAQQGFTNAFTAGAGWNFVNNGSAAMNFDKGDGSNASLSFDALTLGAASVTDVAVNTSAPVSTLLTLGSIAVEQGAQVNVRSTSPAGELLRADRSIVIGTVSGGQAAGSLGNVSLNMADPAFMLLDGARTTLAVDANGNLVLNVVTSRVNKLDAYANNPNSAAGAHLLWGAAFAGNASTGTDIRRVLERLNSGVGQGEGNRILAAASGASVTVLSSAFAADVERQLRAIRNRTTGMEGKPRVASCKGAVAPCGPRIAAWINGEGDHRKMKADGFMPGYSLSSWGGTVGMDMSCSENLVGGLALTALYGDLHTHSADYAKGDFNRYYITAFGSLRSQRWQHTLLGTAGRLDGNFKRSVHYGTGSYHTHADTEGWGYGLMYEIGYDLPVAEDAKFTLQPIANVTWRYTDVDGFTERGSDAALRVYGQDYNTVTFGAGLRAKAEVGECWFNRRALLEGRALVKVDAGDRKGEAMVAMLGGGGVAAKVQSAKLKAVGVELGAGLTIPLGDKYGSLFIDGTAELRNEYSNLNGVVGYRFEF